MKIQVVIVKDVENKPQIKCVCHSTPKMVFVTSNEGLELIRKGAKYIYPIGFSLDQVFVFDGRPIDDGFDWKMAKPWKEIQR